MTSWKSQSFVFIGHSGSGKSLQSHLLEEAVKKDEPEAEIVSFSVGSLFRARAEGANFFAQKIKNILMNGGLPPAWLAETLWIEKLANSIHSQDAIILSESMPRRLHEAEVFDDILRFLGRPRAIPIYLDIPKDESLRRLKERAERTSDKDPKAREALSAWFEREIPAILNYYDSRLISIDGVGEIEAIHERIMTHLSESGPLLKKK
ncbi:MAG: hypothetical protein FJY91_01255 [Candidatus Harrisonbacteria bacterium]|nr:hypothetical protein [Candidatus Harrisonbacteria bacterium]